MAKSESERQRNRDFRKLIKGFNHAAVPPVARKPDSEEVRQRLAEIPPDTRSLTAFFFGDPIPGDPRRADWVEPVDRRNAIRQERYRERLRAREQLA